jgi:hypothetical protein
MKTEKIQCDCILTDEEKLVMSKELSEHISSKKRAEDDLIAFNAQKKAEIKGHDAHINRIAELLNNGREFRTVLCEVQLLDKSDTAVWIRQDTMQIAQQRTPIPEYLRQQEIELK